MDGIHREFLLLLDYLIHFLKEGTSDILTGVPTLKDLGMNRLTEFEYAAAAEAKKLTFYRAYEEEYGSLAEIPLPLRSPTLVQGKFDPKEVFGKKKFRLNIF